jgi:uncharacterized protein
MLRLVRPALWTLAATGLVGCGHGRDTSRGPYAFDLYERGIRTAMLRGGTGPEYSFTVQRRSTETGAWGAPHLVPLDSLARGGGRLPGALRVWAALFTRILASRWDGTTAVALTGDSSVTFTYVRHRSTAGEIDGNASGQDEWALQDGGLMHYGSSPLDFIIDSGGRFVAAIDPSDDDVLVVPGEEQRTTVKLWQRPQVSQGRFGVHALPRVMLPMSDGVHLATYIYLPDSGGSSGRYPAILTRTPYDASQGISRDWSFVARGYAVVYQDVRGRFASEGKFEIDVHEAPDGDETLTWIAHQPWSNGVIGMAGGSYPGHNQWMAASKGNRALRALVPVVSMGTPHGDMPYTGGTLNAGAADWMFSMDGMDARTRAATDWPTLLRHRPTIEIDSLVLGRQSPLWRHMLTHTLYDGAWRKADWLRDGDAIDVPALHLSGWYDDDHPGTLANWAMMAAHHRAHQRLILGGWRHSINHDRELNGVRFGIDVIRPDINFLMLQWYDRFLKDIHNGIDDGPTVEYFSVGDNAWHAATAWPPSDARIQRWYLHSAGDAASAKRGTLSTLEPQHEPTDAYRYDPQDPTPDLIDVSLNEQALPNDYRAVDARPDVAVYETPALRAPLRIAGPLEAVLFASTSRRDTDWMVRVSDVDSAGHAYRLVTGLVRARHRNSMATETLLEPGQVDRYRIGLRSIAATILPGHRLRVSIFSAASGYILPNSNTGEDEAYVTHTVVADQRIHHEGSHASFVELPVLP